MPHKPYIVLDIRVRRALNAAARGRFRRNQTYGKIITWEGYRIFLVKHHLPFGESTHSRSVYTHIIRAVYIAWRHDVYGSRIAGQLALWYCGNATNHFKMLDKSAQPSCPVCLFQLTRSSPTSVV